MRKKDIFEENKELQSSLFLAQSYQDAWADYGRSLKKERFARWDYVVLTASNEEQAEGFREQIKLRNDEGFLPIQTKFLILPDPEGKRVGSGGATLNVLRAIAEEEENSGDFSEKRILVIHSGGDAIAPGPVATAMLGRKEGDTLYTDCIPAKRFATPSEIGQLAVIMVSDMCDLVIGDTFYISGGSGTIQY